MSIRLRTLTAATGPAIFLSLLTAGPAVCQMGGGVSGWLHLSTRTLSLSGGSNAEGKYSEDLDFQSGFQLAGLMLRGQGRSREFGLEASGWGEDPFATLKGWFNRSGLFRLKFGGYNARYFHTTGSFVEAYSLDALPYGYTRRGRYADLALTLGGLPEIYLRYDRFRREGTNLLVWNIEREKHQALSPADETTASLQVATSLPVSFASVDLSYTLYSLDNRYGAVIPDTSAGLDGRPSVIYKYSHIVNDTGHLPVLKANFTAPVGGALIRFGYSSSSGSVDKVLEEREEGLDYTGSQVDTTFSLSGSLERAFSILDAGISLPIIRRISADVSLRQTSFEISGDWDPTGSDVGVKTSVSTLRYSGKIVWRPMRGVSVDLGGANITRTFDDASADEMETVTSDWVGGFTYSRQSWFNLRFSHRIGDIESPYTRLSPTDRNSSRTTLNVMPLTWLTATFSYMSGTATRYYSHEESDPQYYFNTRTSDVRNGTVGITVRDFPMLEGLNGYVGYTRGRLGMNVPIARIAPPSPTVFNYRDVTQVVTGWLSYRLKEGFDIEAENYWFKSSGQWPLIRSMWRIGVVKDMGIFTLHADFRLFSFDQVVDTQDNYEGSLITLGLSRGF